MRPASSEDEGRGLNFVEQIIAGDLSTGKFGDRVQTRFPPEAEWVPPHWARKKYLSEFWDGCFPRRSLQSPL